MTDAEFVQYIRCRIPDAAKELERFQKNMDDNPSISVDALAEAITNFCQQRIRTVDQQEPMQFGAHHASSQVAPDQGHAGASAEALRDLQQQVMQLQQQQQQPLVANMAYGQSAMGMIGAPPRPFQQQRNQEQYGGGYHGGAANNNNGLGYQQGGQAPSGGVKPYVGPICSHWDGKKCHWYRGECKYAGSHEPNRDTRHAHIVAAELEEAAGKRQRSQY
jgi:hypothetical protein